MARFHGFYIIFLLLHVISLSDGVAQDELSDLPLDELAHVKVNAKSAGFLEDKKYTADYIYLGLVVPYSREKEHSLEIKKSIDLAVEEINSAGGVLGKKLDLITTDDADINELTVKYTDSLIRKYNISALIGPTSSRRLMYLATTYLPYQPMLVISPSASSSEISLLKDNDLIWRTTPSDAQQAKLGAHYIYHKLKKKSAGILYIHDVYGSGLAEDFKKNFEGKVVSEVYYSPRVDPKTFAFEDELNTLFKNKPEVIYLVTGGNDAAIITHRIANGKYFSGGYRPLIFSVDAIKGRSFIEQGDKDVVEGTYGTSVTSNKNAAFKKKYFDRYGKYPVSPYCERSYDIAYILALAMEKSKSTNCLDIKKELRNVTEGGVKIGPYDFAAAKEKIKSSSDIFYEGPSGKIRFDHNGDQSQGIFEIWKVTKGQYVTHEILSFDEQK